MNQTFQLLAPFLEKRRKLHYLSSLLNYDLATTCPEDSLEALSELLSEIEVESAAIAQDEEFKALVKALQTETGLSSFERRFVEKEAENIAFLEQVDEERLSAWNLHALKSQEVWRKAKATGDFAAWLPYFEQVVADKKEQCRLKQKDGETLYDVCLRSYEPGNDIAFLDEVFLPLKAYLLRKIPAVLEKEKDLSPSLPKAFPKEKQVRLSYRLLELIGYDLKRGALRESEHPFSDNLSRFDARITTNYDESDFRSSMYSVLHEGGHAIEFQHWPEEQYAHYVEGFASYACCETHSRFFENLLGRSKALMKTYRQILGETLDPIFFSASDEELFAFLNEVHPIANRCDSDELTYSLHILLRYEIEKDLLNGKLAPKDVPSRWNALTKEYLGVKIANDGEGCMQDIHWTDGSFGYFPSYLLGNLYGAMILETMKKDVDVDAALEKGDFAPILAWLETKDFAFDYLAPREWIKRVTGKDLDSSAFISYLDEKYA